MLLFVLLTGILAIIESTEQRLNVVILFTSLVLRIWSAHYQKNSKLGAGPACQVKTLHPHDYPAATVEVRIATYQLDKLLYSVP